MSKGSRRRPSKVADIGDAWAGTFSVGDRVILDRMGVVIVNLRDERYEQRGREIDRLLDSWEAPVVGEARPVCREWGTEGLEYLECLKCGLCRECDCECEGHL